jgi:hypothetical protein
MQNNTQGVQVEFELQVSKKCLNDFGFNKMPLNSIVCDILKPKGNRGRSWVSRAEYILRSKYVLLKA